MWFFVGVIVTDSTVNGTVTVNVVPLGLYAGLHVPVVVLVATSVKTMALSVQSVDGAS